jgi:hypothetical protein
MTASDDIKEGVIHDKIASLDAQAIVGMLARYIQRQEERKGRKLDAITARDRAIVAVFAAMP